MRPAFEVDAGENWRLLSHGNAGVQHWSHGGTATGSNRLSGGGGAHRIGRHLQFARSGNLNRELGKNFLVLRL